MNGRHGQVFDVLVVGGGPAGASLALRLARTGRRTAILDARAFPRSKPCGDAVSPGATPLLRELGVWEGIRARPGVLLEGWRIRSHAGTWVEGRFGEATAETPARGLAIDRRALDAALLDAARDAGATVFERRRVFGLEGVGSATCAPWKGGALREVLARGPDGVVERYRARFVVGADGLRSRVSRLLGPPSRGPRRRLALVARFRGVPRAGPWGELRLSDEGVLGYAPTANACCNFTTVVPTALASRIGPDPETFVRERIRRYGAEARLGRGELDRPVEITGPFDIAPARRTAPGVLLVGDAAGYFDPLTGQGVYRALFGARLAAAAIERCLTEPAAAVEALTEYEAALDAQLLPSRRLQRLVDGVVSSRWLMNPAARLLRRSSGFATHLVDATGDRIPPNELLRPARWLSALVGRTVGHDLRNGDDAYA